MLPIQLLGQTYSVESLFIRGLASRLDVQSLEGGLVACLGLFARIASIAILFLAETKFGGYYSICRYPQQTDTREFDGVIDTF